MRTPHLTLVSEGTPRRRLLIGSKGWLVIELFDVVGIHGTAPSIGSVRVVVPKQHFGQIDIRRADKVRSFFA